MYVFLGILLQTNNIKKHTNYFWCAKAFNINPNHNHNHRHGHHDHNHNIDTCMVDSKVL